MAKKQNIYAKVDFTTLKTQLKEAIYYLQSEPVNDDLQDNIDLKQTKTGGVTPMIVTSLERKIETQMNTLETCSKILKAIFEKEGLSDFVKESIDTLINKLHEIEEYYLNRPISSMVNRKVVIHYGRGDINLVGASKEEQINSRNRVLEKIYKVTPLISELESMREEILLKGGADIPESMRYE